MTRNVMAASLGICAMAAVVVAQENRPMSPAGTAAAQVVGKWVKPTGRGAPTLGGERYEGGKWIEITYGRPLKRGRELWGSGADYGKAANAGAPVWRAGANVSTRLKTDIPLVIGAKTVPAGEYSLFIELKSPTEWNLIVSSWLAQATYDPNNKAALWGAYGYTPDKDVARVPMTVTQRPSSLEQLTWGFADVTDAGGTLIIAWDKMTASVPFKVGT